MSSTWLPVSTIEVTATSLLDSLTSADIEYLSALVPTLCGACSLAVEVDDTGSQYACIIPAAWGFGLDAAFMVQREGAGIALYDVRKVGFGGGAEAVGLFADVRGVGAALRGLMGVQTGLDLAAAA